MTRMLLQQESSVTPSNIFFAEDYLGDPLNDPKCWRPNMRRPLGFGQVEIDRFQTAINRITGTFRDQPIIKLAWMPEVFEWTPHPVGSNPPGYTFPSWTPGIKDRDGNIIAPPRWGLMERMEPEQYLPGWEDTRYVRVEGRWHDAKGPPPEGGMYTRWHRHIRHSDSCCLRAGNEDDCWGYYIEPNAELLEYIGMRAMKAREDKYIDPTRPVAHLSNPTLDRIVKAKLEREMVHNPLPVVPRIFKGFVRRPGSGLYAVGE